jgi:mannose-6-phosphate isomerase
MVHCHPHRDFSLRNLGLSHGKTEAWIVAATRGDEAAVWLGFQEEISRATLDRWVARQDSTAMLAALNRIPVSAGDALYVPGGIPHAIGEGVLLVELQEPTDLSVWLEWEGYSVDAERDGHLGIGLDRALEAVDRSAWSAERLTTLGVGRGANGEAGHAVRELLPAQAGAYFRAQWLRANGRAGELDPEFSIVVVLEGEGRLATSTARVDLKRGDALLIPFAAGAAELSGRIEAVRCLPPAA